MSIASGRAALQAFHATLTSGGVALFATTPTTMPDNIPSAHLPQPLVMAGPGRWTHETFGPPGDQDMRSFIVQVRVAPVVADTDGVSYARAEAMLQIMCKAYLDHATFGDYGISDSGVISDNRLLYAGVAYVGFIITLSAPTGE